MFPGTNIYVCEHHLVSRIDVLPGCLFKVSCLVPLRHEPIEATGPDLEAALSLLADVVGAHLKAVLALRPSETNK